MKWRCQYFHCVKEQAPIIASVKRLSFLVVAALEPSIRLSWRWRLTVANQLIQVLLNFFRQQFHTGGP